ncbi:MAG: hypothetical protein ACD_23C00964G0008 [uncultured bacterium]|jgi:hypothetical protein|nr:MAG: hypothetical protein ACD_23C00964G0008 [uncultured bacterium]
MQDIGCLRSLVRSPGKARIKADIASAKGQKTKCVKFNVSWPTKQRKGTNQAAFASFISFEYSDNSRMLFSEIMHIIIG